MNSSKIVGLGTKPGSGNIYCKIEITKDGRLSINGVEGPKANGDCIGSCGQINMHLQGEQNQIVLAPGWTRPMLARFFEIWQNWHLNDMNPGCAHQVGPAWRGKDVTLYNFNLTAAVLKAQNAAKQAAEDALKAGATFTPTTEQARLACLSYSVTSYQPEAPEDYEPAKGTTYSRPSERKSTSWLTEAEHPDGFLSKPCPVCGYKYGTKWNKRELPADVIEFLTSLPDTDKTPAWV